MRAPHTTYQSRSPSSTPLSLRVLSIPARQSPGPIQDLSLGDEEPTSPASGSLDLASTLAGWAHEPGRLNVRKIQGDDGNPKLQVRLDLGLLQMEWTGRPDGQRPHDFASLLDYHIDRLNAHRTHFGTELGYLLSPNDCRELRDEASMYYHRYLGLFVLGEYAATVRDTRRNLDAIDFCGRHAAEERDRVAMEAYRPYALMMHARASAGIALQQGDPVRALRSIRVALRQVRRHFQRFGGRRAYRESGEVRVLKKLSDHLSRCVPQSPERSLKRQLRHAIRREEYERAAVLRDQIGQLEV